jgi:uncharacterized membrane protein YbhN (UPF0104 family)
MIELRLPIREARGRFNILCIGGVLYAALRSFVPAEYATIAALYVSSDITALTAHVPGGWGVLEYIVTSVLGEEHVLAGIVLCRLSMQPAARSAPD